MKELREYIIIGLITITAIVTYSCIVLSIQRGNKNDESCTKIDTFQNPTDEPTTEIDGNEPNYKVVNKNPVIVSETEPTTETIIVEESTELIESSTELVEESTINAEIEYLARCILAEAGDQDEYGMRLVIDVILNRVESDRFPNSITEVINQPHQFEVISNGSIYNQEPYDRIYELIYQEMEYQQDYEILYFKMYGYFDFGTPVIHHLDHYFSK